MAISKVQVAVYAYNAGNTVTASFPNTPATGNLMIAWGKSDQTVAKASITGWTRAVETTPASGGDTFGLWYKVAGADESKDVVLAWTDSTATYLIIEEWTGLSATPLDQIANVDTTGGTVTSRSSGTTPNTTIANELCIAGITTGNAVTAQSWSNSFTEEFAKPGGFLLLFGASLIVAATGAYETTLSWTTARLAGGFIATFKAASANLIAPKVDYYRRQRE